MNDPNRYQAALATVQLPTEWQVDVVIRPRRRRIGIEVKPGGAVAILIPPTAGPEYVVRFVRGHLRWITKNVTTAARLAPNHSVKQFINGEQFDLLGQRYRLQLVDTPPAGIKQLPTFTADHVLYVQKQRPEQIRRAIIGLYRQVGLTWATREGRQYEQDGQITDLRYEVRDLGRHRWGSYYRPPKHTTTLHWAVFGLPMRYIEYVLVHEQAHATRPPGQAHGPAWQRQMSRWMPDWQQRKTDLAETGRHCWLGEHTPLRPTD